MGQRDVIRRKLISLSGYIKELEPFNEYTFDEYVGNYFIKRTGERLIQLVVENMVDINSILIAKNGHEPPRDYYSSFELLGKIEAIPVDFASQLAPCTGMRNRLIHEYDKIQDEIVFESISKLINMTLDYIKFVNKKSLK